VSVIESGRKVPHGVRTGRAYMKDTARGYLGADQVRVSARERDRYALDPFALADDGKVSVPDLRSMRPVPLVLWPHQREIIEAWVDIPYLRETGYLRFRNVHEEKSRQMGVTWVTAYLAHWIVAYHSAPGLALSRKLGEICDPGFTIDSFFGRIRYIHMSLPDHLRQPLEFVGGNDPSVRNPGMHDAYITGEGANLDPGRGGKYAWVFLDEAARIPWGRSVHASVTRACPEGRFYNSTPAGEDDLYFWLRKTRPEGYTFLRHHWVSHPVYGEGAHIAATDEGLVEQPTDLMTEATAACPLCKGTIAKVDWDATQVRSHRYPGKLASPWYDRAIVELTDEQVAEELDIDYAGSLTARVYPEFSEDIHVVDRIDVEHTGLRTVLFFDYGLDVTSVIIGQESPTELRLIAEFEQGDLVPEEVAEGVRASMRRAGWTGTEVRPEHTRNMLCIGDPAGESRTLATGRPLTSDYGAAGFQILSRVRRVTTTIIATKRLLMGRPKRLVISKAGCPRLIEHLKMNRWPVDRAGNRKPAASAPLDDQHNHAARALAYGITYLYPPPSTDEALEDQWGSTRSETPWSGPGVDMTIPRDVSTPW
jgi:hypothetical protein